MREMQALVRNYVLNRDRQMKYLAVLIALSLFVSFMVPFILMQPADSMAEASACGIEEHVHTEEAGCYQLFCAPEEGEEHVHSERCYALICEKIVHTHTPNCYPTKPDFSALFSTIYDPENLKATADGKSYANSPKDKPSEYKAPAGSILGVATHFHIFAESVSLQSHVHGNIATNMLLQNGAFGVYNDRLNGMSSINYIRNLGPNGNLDNAYQTQLIMGSDYSSPPSFWFSNRYEIRSKKDRKTYYIPKDKFPMWFAPEYVQPQVKFEKKDRPFINITQELNKFADMSMDLVEEAGAMDNDLGVSTKYPTVKSDPNGNFNGQSTTTPGTVVLQTQGENLTLDFSNIDDKYIYYTIDATNFDMVSPWSSWMKVLEIKGITEDKFLFLNIDVGTNPDAYFSKSWMVYKDDGTTYGTGEVPLEDGGCRVIYNIVSSDGNGGNYKPFEGKAVFGERRNGSILAPNADVNVAGNTNGTIIARNFVATGESHRCDIQQEGTEGDDADWSLGEDTPKPPQPKKIEITVQKEWSGQQLGQVKVYLYKSTTPNLDVATANLGTPHKEATLSSGNSWQTVFKDLPAEEAGKTLYYYVKEESLNNYTATYDKNGLSGNNGTVKITNVEQVQNITVSVEKKWDHPSGSSTSDITVILYKSSNPNLDATKPDQFTGNNATVAGTATLNSSNNWNATFNNLPAKENGNTLYYYIVEQNVPENYTVSYIGNGVNSANGKVTVTNAKGKMVSVTAKKQWKPSVPSNAIPVKVKLYQSKDSGLDATKPEQFSGMKEIDSATLSASNNWTCKFKEYPAANAKGEMYYYYIVESPVQSGYSAIYTNNGLSFNDGEIVVTNVKDITVTAKKIWDPDTVASAPTTQETKTYKIMPIGDSITQGHGQFADGSTGETGGYRKYLDYLLKQEGYSIDMVGPNGTYPNPATFTYNGQSVTYDNNHAGWGAHWITAPLDGNKDWSLFEKLKTNDAVNQAQPDIVLLTIGTNNINGAQSPATCESQLHELIDYILENLPSDSVIFLGSIPDIQRFGENSTTITEYNNIVKRVAQSYANSLKNVRFVDVHAWVHFNELYDGLHPNETAYQRMGKNWATVIDSYIQELQPVSSVPAETREPINVRLYKSQYGNLDATNADHVTQMQEVARETLNSDNGWTGKFEGLPAMENGSTLYYYVVEEEEDVPKHYTVTYSNNAVNNNDGTVVVTNTKEKMLNITLDKEWVGGKPDNEDITVTLYQSTERNLDMTVSDSEFDQLLTDGKLKVYRDEKDTGESSVTFTAGETPHFTNLPIYDADGKMYYYYVRESDVSGYKPTYSKNPVYGADKVVTITNTKTISVSVTKNWQDTNGGTQYNGQTVTINLYKYKHIPAEGEMSYWPTTYMPVGSVLVSSQDIYQNDTATFGDLPVEENGYKLFYYIEEIVKDENTAKKYDTIYGEDGNGQLADPNQTATYGKTVINKEKDENKISISVKKKWDVSDYWNDDGDGVIEPPNEYYVQDSVNPPEAWADPIKVTLQYSYDGTTWTNYSADCTDVEFYTNHTFMNLPKQINGQNVRYKIVESYNYGYVTDYGDNNNIEASTITKDTATPVIELKNTLLKRTLNVKKNWYNNIDEGVDKVVVEVYRRTSTKKPDLGIGEDGTLGGSGNGGNTGGDTDTVILQGMFENGSNDGWTLTGSHSSDTLTSGVVSSTSWDASNDSGPGAYMVYIHGLIEYTNQDVLSKLASGNTYSISAQATRPYYSKIVVNYSDGTSETFTFTDKSQNTAWTDISAEFTVPSGKTVSSLQIGINHDGGLWGDPLCIDDVKVELVSSGGTTPEQPVDPNDLIHDTFESGTDGWYAVGSDIRTSSDQKFVGSSSLEVYSRDATWAGAQKTLDPDVFIPGNTYSFSVNACYAADPDNTAEGASSEAAASNDIKLTLVYKDAEENDHYDQINLINTAGAGNWIKLENTGFKIPDGATDIQVKVEIPTSLDKIYIDEFIARLVSTGSGSTGDNTGGDTTTKTVTYDFEDGTVQGWGGLSGWTNPPVSWGGHNDALSLHAGGSIYHNLDSSDFPAGHSYDFSAYVWKNGNAVNASLELHYDNAAGSPVTIATKENANGDKLEGRATIPAGATNVKLVLNVTGSDQFLADDITITGPYPSSNSKPRNAETFFTNTSTLTKRKLNIQKMETVKLAKATNEYKSINKTIPVTTWSLVDKTDSDGNVVKDEDGNVVQEIKFSGYTETANSSDLAFMEGAELSHIEVHFRTSGNHFSGSALVPQNTNVWLTGGTGNGSGPWDYEMNSDQTIHTFAPQKTYTFGSNSALQVRAMNANDIERIIVKCKDGSMLVINNVKTVSAGDNYGSFNVNPNKSKSITLQQWTSSNGSFTLGWDLGSTELSSNEVWSGQSLTSIDVYFNENTVDSNTLTTDNSNMKNAMDTNNNLSNPAQDWQKNANISQYAMYLMLNHVKDASWFGTELVSTGIWTETQNGMTVAHYDIPDTTLTNGLENTLVMMTTMPENVKAIVVNAGNGQKYELLNTAYKTPTTTVQDPLTPSSDKWYPIMNTVKVSDENTNNAATFEILLTPEELYGELGGKKVTKVEVVTRMHTSWIDCNTFFNSNGATADSGNKLGVTSWKGNVKTYSATRKKINDVEQDIQVYLEQGDRLFFRANGTTDQINKVIVYFEGGTSYTVKNMNFVEYDPLKKEHQTGFNSVDSSTNLLQTAGTQYTDYADKYLNYIIVNYGNVTAQPQDKLVVNGTQYSGTPVDGNNSVIRYNVTSGSFDATGLNITSLNLIDGAGDGMDINYIKDIVMYYDTDTENDTGTGLEWWSTYTITNTDFSDYVPPEGEIHNGHETSFKQYGTSQLLNNSSTYRGYSTKSAEYVIVKYGEDGDEFVSIPRDLISLNDNQGSPTIDVNGDVTMKHTFTNSITNASVLKIIEDASDNATLADIKELTIYYTDGSTYTVGNTDYSPKVEPDVPAIGNQPALGSDFVFIDTLELTKDPETGEWIGSLEGLPVTDGQGNAYEYVIVEKAVYGKDADKYQLVSYEHPDGVILEKDGTQTSFLNTTTDDENGLVIMPSSGGEGKTWFYVAGVALMLCGIAGCYGMKRRQRSRR